MIVIMVILSSEFCDQSGTRFRFQNSLSDSEYGKRVVECPVVHRDHMKYHQFLARVYIFSSPSGSTHKNLEKFGHVVLSARCYASAVLAVVVCLSVCPSYTGIVSKRLSV